MQKNAALLENLAARTNGMFSALRDDPCLEERLLRIPDGQYTLDEWQYALCYLLQSPCCYSSVKELKADLPHSFAASSRNHPSFGFSLKNA